MESRYEVKIPMIGKITALSIAVLGIRVRTAIDEQMAAASDVGSLWTVKKDGKKVGTMSYNSRFTACVVTK